MTVTDTPLPSRVWTIGDRATLSLAAASLTPPPRVRHWETFNALAMRTDPEPPDLVLISLDWPDQFGPSAIRERIEAFRSARLLCCVSEWCASMNRSRSDWPLSLIVHPANATQRIRYELEVIAGRAMAIPLTAGREELAAMDLEDPDGCRRL